MFKIEKIIIKNQTILPDQHLAKLENSFRALAIVCNKSSTAPDLKVDDASESPALLRFKHLSCKMKAAGTAVPSATGESTSSQLNRYMAEAANSNVANALEFWHTRKNNYSASLVQTAEDLLCAPASQAYVEV
jgi:hypothetical protein